VSRRNDTSTWGKVPTGGGSLPRSGEGEQRCRKKDLILLPQPVLDGTATGHAGNTEGKKKKYEKEKITKENKEQDSALKVDIFAEAAW